MIFNMVGGGSGGGKAGLNFELVGGTTAPTSPKVNTIWLNTDAEISSWHFGEDEPNVYNLKTISENDAHTIVAPHRLSEGDILNFEIPMTVLTKWEAINIKDPETGKRYYVRQSASAVSAWAAGIKVGVKILDTSYPVGSYGSDGGTARLLKWADYYHEEGTIWIKTYKYSTVDFNILKENGVYVRPLCARQYIGGAWVDKSAKTYQNGEWVDWWNGELYLTGNEFTDITGGWYGMDTGLSTSNVNITKIESGLKLHLTANNRKIGIMATRKPIDLTDYNTITFTGYIFKSTASTSGKEAYGYLMVYSDISGGSLTQVARADISNGGKPTTITINVSDLKGFYNICPYMYSFDASAPYMVMNSLILS